MRTEFVELIKQLNKHVYISMLNYLQTCVSSIYAYDIHMMWVLEVLLRELNVNIGGVPIYGKIKLPEVLPKRVLRKLVKTIKCR